MSDIRLEVYTFNIHKLNFSEELPVQKFDGTHSFYKFFHDYTQSLKKDIYINTQQKKSVQFNPSVLRKYPDQFTISGIIESGEYGTESKIIDSVTKKNVFKKEVHHLDVNPFYFLVCSPANLKSGIIILQRTGIYGINTVFTTHLSQFFKDKFPDFRMRFNTYIAKDLARNLLSKGAINEIKLIRKNLPRDVADKLGILNLQKDILRMEFKIIAKPKNSFSLNSRAKKFVKNPNASFFEVEELESLGFDNSEQTSTKIKVKIGKNSRTVDLGDMANLRPYYDIRDELTFDATGHPSFLSINKAGTNYLQDILEDLRTNV